MSLTPAAPSSGGPTAKQPFLYPFEKDQAARRVLAVREAEVVGYVAKGKQNLGIALELSVQEYTSEKHMENILAKLQAESQIKVTAWYYEKELRASATQIVALQAENQTLKMRLRELGG